MLLGCNNALLAVTRVMNIKAGKRYIFETGNGVGNKMYSISYRKRSKCSFICDGHKWDIGAQSIVYISPETKFVRDCCEDENIIAIHFTAVGINDKKIDVIYPEDAKSYEKLFDEIFDVFESKSAGYMLRCNEILFRILYMLACDESKKAKITPENAAQSAAEMIEQHVSDSYFSLGSLAGEFKISSTGLRTIFKEKYGMSPKEYQVKKRMELAAALIKLKRGSIKQISEACGYADAKYFSAAFKQYYGKNPKEFETLAED